MKDLDSWILPVLTFGGSALLAKKEKGKGTLDPPAGSLITCVLEAPSAQAQARPRSAPYSLSDWPLSRFLSLLFSFCLPIFLSVSVPALPLRAPGWRWAHVSSRLLTQAI